jgi:hypothetical protein
MARFASTRSCLQSRPDACALRRGSPRPVGATLLAPPGSWLQPRRGDLPCADHASFASQPRTRHSWRCRLRQGRTPQALYFFNQALPLWRQVGDRFGEVITRWWLGLLYAGEGDLRQNVASRAGAACPEVNAWGVVLRSTIKSGVVWFIAWVPFLVSG